MGKVCSAVNCKNRQGCAKATSKHFYGLPTDKDRRRKWISFLNRKTLPKPENIIVCGGHFISGKIFWSCTDFACMDLWREFVFSRSTFDFKKERII